MEAIGIGSHKNGSHENGSYEKIVNHKKHLIKMVAMKIEALRIDD